MAVYQLTERTARILIAKGLPAIQSRASSANSDALNLYGPWKETPGQLDVERNGHGASYTVYGLYALDGCSGTSGSDYHAREIEEALKIPGSYYRVSANREGIFVVVPSRRLAGYYYWG